jgi:hypothetical protein
MKTLILSIAMLCGACASAPAHPAPVPDAAPVAIQYAINIPSAVIANQLNGQYPNGVTLSPIEAQRKFDFTSTYHTPNVYYGIQAPPPGAYIGVGIVVAPLLAASKATFTSADWPGICASTCTWLGRFAYAQPPTE